jgi:hypothetical protein
MLRARIAAALAEFLLAHAATTIGEQIGHAGTTVTRRGEDLAQWPTSDLLLLAIKSPGLTEAIIRYLRGDLPVRGQAVALVGDLHGLLGQCGRLLCEAAEILRDGKVDADEAKRLRGIIRVIRDSLEMVEADLGDAP